jgi:hypothetical protein
VVDVKHAAGRSVARVLGIREAFIRCWWSAPSSALASSSAASPCRISCKIDGNGVLQVQHASFHNGYKNILSGSGIKLLVKLLTRGNAAVSACWLWG